MEAVDKVDTLRSIKHGISTIDNDIKGAEIPQMGNQLEKLNCKMDDIKGDVDGIGNELEKLNFKVDGIKGDVDGIKNPIPNWETIENIPIDGDSPWKNKMESLKIDIKGGNFNKILHLDIYFSKNKLEASTKKSNIHIGCWDGKQSCNEGWRAIKIPIGQEEPPDKKQLDKLNSLLNEEPCKNIDFTCCHHDPDKNTHYIVMPLYDYSLSTLLDEKTSVEKTSVEKRFNLTTQLFDAVKYLHKRGICHRDLKPNNVMIDNKSRYILKLIDFEYAREDNGKSVCAAGNPHWIDPSNDLKSSHKFGILNESFVVIMMTVYIMAHGKHPFLSGRIPKGHKKPLSLKYICTKTVLKFTGDVKNRLDEDFPGTAGYLLEVLKKFNLYLCMFEEEGEEAKDEEGAKLTKNYSLDSTLDIISSRYNTLKDYPSVSPNHTRGKRFLVLLPFTWGKPTDKSPNIKNLILDPVKGFFSNTKSSLPPLRRALVNCAWLTQALEACNFETQNVYDDPTVQQKEEIFTMIKKSVSKNEQFCIFVYVYAHGSYNKAESDTQFTVQNDGAKKVFFVKKFIDEIKAVYNGMEAKLIFVVQTCRHHTDQEEGDGEEMEGADSCEKMESGEEKPHPHVALYYSVKVGAKDEDYGNLKNARESRPSKFVRELATRMVPRAKLSMVIDEIHDLDRKPDFSERNKDIEEFIF